MRRERFDKMNVIPFIDIVLVLLVIVLATASFISKQTIGINLPAATSTTTKEDPKNITIAINAKGEYFYEKAPITLEKLKEKLLVLNPQQDTLSLHTDEKTTFDNFVAIIDILKERQFEKLDIVTIPQ